MERDTVKEKIERFKGKADLFLKNDVRVFIVDIYENYFFCHILSVGEDYILVEGFKGKRKYEKDRILWLDVIKLEEYKEVHQHD